MNESFEDKEPGPMKLEVLSGKLSSLAETFMVHDARGDFRDYEQYASGIMDRIQRNLKMDEKNQARVKIESPIIFLLEMRTERDRVLKEVAGDESREKEIREMFDQMDVPEITDRQLAAQEGV